MWLLFYLHWENPLRLRVIKAFELALTTRDTCIWQMVGLRKAGAGWK